MDLSGSNRSGRGTTDVDWQDREIFQSIILDHDGHPRNFRRLDKATHSADGYNPVCGDRYEVFLSVDDGRIVDISFTGYGCALSKASASIMTTILLGKTVVEAGRIFDRFGELIGGGDHEEELGELLALQGVRRWPSRIKCATLAWYTMRAALEGRGQATTE